MSDTATNRPSASSTQPGSASSSPARTSGASGSERGTTTIADAVVAKIASLAAREVQGVSELGGSVSGALGGMVGRIRGSEHATTGVGVEVGEKEAAVDVTLRAEYPAKLHQIADGVRQNVIGRIESMTGLDVVEVNVHVTDLVFPGSEDDEQPVEQAEPRVQ